MSYPRTYPLSFHELSLPSAYFGRNADLTRIHDSDVNSFNPFLRTVNISPRY